MKLKKSTTAKGSITVFMTFIFIIILGLVLAVFENTRIISSTGYVKNAASGAEKSLFGDYNLELYKEYGLFGYGGYNGISSEDMRQEFEEIVRKNLCVKPEDFVMSYTDIYKIRNVEVKLKVCQGFKDGDNWYRQIKACLADGAVEDIAEKIKNKHNENSICDKDTICKNLEEGDSYETGEYKQKYAACEDEEKNESGDKNLETDSNDDSKSKAASEADVGNPLEVFKELVQNGYLSLVCDSAEVSGGSIEKAFEAPDDETEENEDVGTSDISSEDYESAGDFLKNIFMSTDTRSDEFAAMGSCGKDKLAEMFYADKKLSSYTKSSTGAVHYGMEYLICGKKSEKDNLTGVINRIITTRMLANFAVISRDEEIKSKALATATAIAGITGIEPVIKGVQYVILAILAFEESCIDTAALLDGREIPVIKRISDIKIKYEEICMASGVFFREKAAQYKVSDGSMTVQFTDYKEYLLGFLSVVPEEKIKSRLFDVIQQELRRYNESFRIYDCIVAADYDVTYGMKFMFPFLWNMYGDSLKYKKFKRQVSVGYRYG